MSSVHSFSTPLEWRLERYARMVLPEKQKPLQFQETTSAAKTSNWQHYSSADGILNLLLLEDNHLTVSCGNKVYESFSLWEAKKWMRVVTKGDSALFIIKHKDENRRFRVKFSSSLGSSLETCRNCISVLSSHVPVTEMSTNLASSSIMPNTITTMEHKPSGDDGNGTDENGGRKSSHFSGPVAVMRVCETAGDNFMSISEITKMVKSKGQELGGAYRSTNFPTEQLGSFIKLCLTDANFPGFVEAVEKELNTIIKD